MDNTTFDQLNHIINVTLIDVDQFELHNRQYTTLQSLYTMLDHQLQDGLIHQHEFHHTPFIV